MQDRADSAGGRRPGRALLTLILAAADLYAVLVMGFVLLHRLTAERLWPVAFLVNLLPWLLLPALLTVPLTLALRRWRRAALAALPLIAFALLYGDLFLPDLRPARACADPGDGCRALRVMTYNLLGDSRPDQDAQIAILRGSGADLIALQEVSEPVAARIEAELADVYPYRILYPEGIPGTGLLSRYPIVRHEPLRYTSRLLSLYAVIWIDGRPVRVISAHPPPPGMFHGTYLIRGSADIAALTALALEGGPTLLLGDFNTADQTADYASIRRAGLRDAFREAGWGLGVTFPARFAYQEDFPPLVRIDYIWLTEDFRAVRAWVGPDGGSDHLPVLADLVWQGD